MKRKKPFLRLLPVLILCGLLLAACGGDSAGPTTPAQTVGSGQTNPQTGGQVPANLTPGAGVVAPQVGADGQITVVAPPASGGNFPGLVVWVGQNNIWIGGDKSQAPALTASSLGGKALTKVEPLAQTTGPVISPDSSQVAYAYSPEPSGSPGNIVIGQDIWLYDLKSNQTKMLIKRDEPQTFLDQAAWSADGKYLYFSYRSPTRDQKGVVTGEKIGIDRFEIATNTRQKLIEDARYPAPMPDGKSVVYVATDASGSTYESDLRMLDLTTKKSTVLIDKNKGFLQYYVPRPSPTGDLIVFSGVGGPDTMVPGAPVPGVPAPTTTKASASKDSFGIALLNSFGPGMLGAPSAKSVAAHGLPYDLWLMKPDGSDLRRLTTLFEDDPVPAWSKTGKQIGFIAGLGTYIIDVDGKNLVKKSDKGSHGGFDWKD